MRTTGPGQSSLLLLDVIDILDARGILYAVVGAFAASFYGVVRASMDADAVVALRPGHADVKALSNALRNAGLQSTYRKGDARDPVGAVISISDQFHNRVDLLMRIRGMDEAVFSRTVEAEFMQARVRVVGLEDFIAMKVFAGGPKDLSDATGVLQVSSRQLHVPLLKKLVQAYGRDAVRTLHSLLQGHRP